MGDPPPSQKPAFLLPDLPCPRCLLCPPTCGKTWSGLLGMGQDPVQIPRGFPSTAPGFEGLAWCFVTLPDKRLWKCTMASAWAAGPSGFQSGKSSEPGMSGSTPGCPSCRADPQSQRARQPCQLPVWITPESLLGKDQLIPRRLMNCKVKKSLQFPSKEEKEKKLKKKQTQNTKPNKMPNHQTKPDNKNQQPK